MENNLTEHHSSESNKSSLTPHKIRKTILVSETGNETTLSDESKKQISSGTTLLPIPVSNTANIDINNTLCSLLHNTQYS